MLFLVGPHRSAYRFFWNLPGYFFGYLPNSRTNWLKIVKKCTDSYKLPTGVLWTMSPDLIVELYVPFFELFGFMVANLFAQRHGKLEVCYLFLTGNNCHVNQKKWCIYSIRVTKNSKTYHPCKEPIY